MREQVEKQSEVIEKLSRAQELLMMQYKVMELGLNKELAQIKITQKEISKMQGKSGEDEDEEDEEEVEDDNNDKEDQDEPEESDKPDDKQE